MSRNCGCSRNSGCNRNSGFQGSRNQCDRGFETYDDFTEIFASEERNVGPYTWNGYVWYDIEVEFSGPYFGGRTRSDNRTGNGCGRNGGNNNGRCGCGCGCN